MPKTENEVKTASLAFRVRDMGQNLFTAEILLLRGDSIVDRRIGVATTLGHAIGAADDLMDGWACSMIETRAEQYFKEVML